MAFENCLRSKASECIGGRMKIPLSYNNLRRLEIGFRQVHSRYRKQQRPIFQFACINYHSPLTEIIPATGDSHIMVFIVRVCFSISLFSNLTCCLLVSNLKTRNAGFLFTISVNCIILIFGISLRCPEQKLSYNGHFFHLNDGVFNLFLLLLPAV